MNNWNGPTDNHLWNDSIHVLHNFWRVDINATAYGLQSSSPVTNGLHGQALKSYGFGGSKIDTL